MEDPDADREPRFAVPDTYVRTERDDRLEKAFKHVWRRTKDPRVEARCLVLVGETGAGKSEALKTLFRKRGLLGSDVFESMSMPFPATLKIWGRMILWRTGYPLKSDLKENLVWDIVRARLAQSRLKVLHFDEFQHVSENANQPQQDAVLNTLKHLLIGEHARPTGLVVSGLPDIVSLVESDQQVRRRCFFVRFGPLHPVDHAEILERTAAHLCERAGLSLDAAGTFDLARRLIHAANGQLGSAIDLLRAAIGEAIEREEQALLLSHFAEAFGVSSGNAEASNPFLSEDWANIDCGRALLGTGHGAGASARTYKRPPRTSPRAGAKRKGAS